MKKLLIIGLVWPEPSSTAAGWRMIQLINFFQKQDYNITFVCTASKTDKSFQLEKLAVHTFQIELNNPSFDVFLKQLDPTIVLFDRFITEEQFGWRIAEICPNALRILDTEDLHFLRDARERAFKGGDNLALNYLISDLAKREIASIYRCDLTLIISKYEINLLEKTFKIDISILIYIPFLLNKLTPEKIYSYPTFEQRSNFVTIGNFKHAPNYNAVVYLKKKIWPIIFDKLPMAKMLVYGSYIPDNIQALNDDNDGFLIKGWAERTEDIFINARVCLAPLKFGAGLKGKLIESMKYGTPNVTSTIGSEGMTDGLPWSGFIEDDPAKFAQKAIELYEGKKVWKISQKNGINIINNCFSLHKFELKLLKKIEELLLKLSEHRLQNFTGAMLMHHSLKSTKYLSKWIEEKNSK